MYFVFTRLLLRKHSQIEYCNHISQKIEKNMPQSQGAKMDLIKRSLPKQKSFKSLIFIPQGFKRTLNENPPTREFFFDRFGLPEQGSNRGPLD